MALKGALHRTSLIDGFRMFYIKAAKYEFFFSSAHETCPKIEHKTSPIKFKKTEIISSVFSDHNGIKLEINYKEN